MTISGLTHAPVSVPVGQPQERQVLRWLEWGAFALVFAVWAFYVLPARGGWESYVVPVATALLVPSLLVLRPWRHCPPWLLVLASAPALGTFVVAAASPYGDGAAISLSRWGYFGGVLLATAAFVRSDNRRRALVAGLALVALHQYAQAWLPWWGGGGSIRGPMLGTIYSANPFGSLMLGFALLCGALALLGDRPLRRLGFLTAPFCAVAVVLSAARAAMLLLGCGLVVLGVVAVRRSGLAGLGRLGLLVALSAGVFSVSTSSAFFQEESSALEATTAKALSGQTLDSTTGVRFDYWSAAWGEFVDQPVLGGGAGSYLGDSRTRMSPAAERSPFAHSEVLGSLAEGGLVLGVPVLAVFVAGLVGGARLLLRAIGRGTGPDPLRLAAAVAAGGLLLHALLDFALSFPAILALLGMLLALVLAAGDAPPAQARTERTALAAACVVLIALSGVYAGLSHDRNGVSGLVPSTSVAEPLPGVHDARATVASARAVLADLRAGSVELRRAERELDNLAPFDGNVEALRLDLLDELGESRRTLPAARALALRSRETSPLLLLPYAERLAGSGEPDLAADLLLGEVYDRAGEGGRIQSQLLDLLAAAQELAGPSELGTTCAARALQESGVLADENKVTELIDPRVDQRQCSVWSARAEMVLGDRS